MLYTRSPTVRGLPGGGNFLACSLPRTIEPTASPLIATRALNENGVGIGALLNKTDQLDVFRLNHGEHQVPAPAVVNRAAKSSVPSIGFAETYTLANVLLNFAGTFLMTP